MGCVLELRNRLDWKHITSWARCFWCGLASEAWTYTDCFSWTFTAWDVSLFGVFLVCIFLHLDWIRRFIVDMEIYSVNLSIPPVDTCRSLLIRPENIRKSYAFWCFLRIQKWNIHCVKYNTGFLQPIFYLDWKIRLGENTFSCMFDAVICQIRFNSPFPVLLSWKGLD